MICKEKRKPPQFPSFSENQESCSSLVQVAWVGVSAKHRTKIYWPWEVAYGIHVDAGKGQLASMMLQLSNETSQFQQFHLHMKVRFIRSESESKLVSENNTTLVPNDEALTVLMLLQCIKEPDECVSELLKACGLIATNAGDTSRAMKFLSQTAEGGPVAILMHDIDGFATLPAPCICLELMIRQLLKVSTVVARAETLPDCFILKELEKMLVNTQPLFVDRRPTTFMS